MGAQPVQQAEGPSCFHSRYSCYFQTAAPLRHGAVARDRRTSLAAPTVPIGPPAPARGVHGAEHAAKADVRGGPALKYVRGDTVVLQPEPRPAGHASPPDPGPPAAAREGARANRLTSSWASGSSCGVTRQVLRLLSNTSPESPSLSSPQYPPQPSILWAPDWAQPTRFYRLIRPLGPVHITRSTAISPTVGN
jgi:hypothetical protein